MIYILLKAEQVGLFDMTVPIKGHATKTGTYVSPYQAKRKKRLDDPSADLFGGDAPIPVQPVIEPAPQPQPQPKPEPKKSEEDELIDRAYQKGKEITGETGKICMRGILGKQSSRTVGTVAFEGTTYPVRLVLQTRTGRVSIDLVDKKSRIGVTHVADDQSFAHGMGALLAALNPDAELIIDLDRADPARVKATAEEKQAAAEAKALEYDKMSMRHERANLGGDASPQPWDDMDLMDYREIRRMSAQKYKTAGTEHSIELHQEQLKADPRKWTVGQGVGWKATIGQINRGYQIIAMDPANKTARIRSVADTGLTRTGGDHDKMADESVHIAWLIRDKKYDKKTDPKPTTPPPLLIVKPEIKPFINTNRLTLAKLIQVAADMGITIIPNKSQTLASQRQTVLDAIAERQKNTA